MTVQFEIEKARPEIGASDVAALLLDVIPLAGAELRKDLQKFGGTSEKCLTVPQIRILVNLSIEPANNKTLAELLGVSVPATSRMVKMLAQRGLVETTKALEDKREVRVRLTTEGTEVLAQVRRKLSSSLNERMWSVSVSELRKAEAGLIALKKILIALQLGPNQ